VKSSCVHAGCIVALQVGWRAKGWLVGGLAGILEHAPTMHGATVCACLFRAFVLVRSTLLLIVRATVSRRSAPWSHYGRPARPLAGPGALRPTAAVAARPPGRRPRTAAAKASFAGARPPRRPSFVVDNISEYCYDHYFRCSATSLLTVSEINHRARRFTVDLHNEEKKLKLQLKQKLRKTKTEKKHSTRVQR